MMVLTPAQELSSVDTSTVQVDTTTQDVMFTRQSENNDDDTALPAQARSVMSPAMTTSINAVQLGRIKLETFTGDIRKYPKFK